MDLKNSKFISSISEFEENWLLEFKKAMKMKSEMLKEDLTMLLSKQHFMSELVDFLVVRV